MIFLPKPNENNKNNNRIIFYWKENEIWGNWGLRVEFVGDSVKFVELIADKLVGFIK